MSQIFFHIEIYHFNMYNIWLYSPSNVGCIKTKINIKHNIKETIFTLKERETNFNNVEFYMD